MIVSFASRETEDVFNDKRSRSFPSDVMSVARRRLLMLHAAHDLRDLKVPPGNRLEALKGDRKGQYSIRINDKWRICFFFRDGNASLVEITDYH